MATRCLSLVLASVSLSAGCGGSPSSPSPSAAPAKSSLSAEFAVTSAMSQAMSQVALAAGTSTDAGNVFQMACAGGGTMVITFSTLPQLQQNLYRSSSRIEFHDCRNQTATLNGDPYLDSAAELSFSGLSGTGDSVSTLQTTGGLRIDSSGVLGRVQINCTTTVSVHSGSGSPQMSVTSSGTITYEQPLGSTPVVRPCGPA